MEHNTPSEDMRAMARVYGTSLQGHTPPQTPRDAKLGTYGIYGTSRHVKDGTIDGTYDGILRKM